MTHEALSKLDKARMLLKIHGMLSDAENEKVKRRLDKEGVKIGVAVNGKLPRMPEVFER